MKFDLGPDTRCDLDVLTDTRVLVQANSGGGKSWLLRRILEETFGHVQHLVIDPEGEFASLRERFDYVLAAKQGGDTIADPRFAKLLAHRLLELKASAILDIYELKAHERVRFVRLFLEALVDAPKAMWHPVLVIVDEAHVYCPQKGDAESAGAVIDLATRGRKRGFCAVLATQRLSKLHKDAAAECNNKLIGRTGLDLDMARAGEELGFSAREDRLSLRDLKPGEFYAFGPALNSGVSRVMIGPVVTTHPKAGARIAFTPPPPSEKIRRLLPQLADLPAEAEEKAKTEADLRRELAEARRKLTLAERAQPAAAPDETTIERRVTAALAAAGRERIAADRLVASLVLHAEKAMLPLRGAVDGVEGSLGRLRAALDGASASEPGVVALTTPKVSIPSRPLAAGMRTATTPGPVAEGLDGLRSGAVRILRELARRYPLFWTKAQVGTLVGFGWKGGTFRAYIGDLKRRDFIEINGKEVRATAAGVNAAGEVPEAPQTHDETMAMWRDKLRSGCYQLLEAIIVGGEDGVVRDELAASTDYTMTGGTFRAYVGDLRRNGLVEQHDGRLVACDMLWPER